MSDQNITHEQNETMALAEKKIQQANDSHELKKVNQMSGKNPMLMVRDKVNNIFKKQIVLNYKEKELAVK